MPKFCYLGDTLGSGGGVVEAARARVRCAWAKFKELSPILTVCGASYRIKGRIYSACVQSVLIYGTETWAMKAADLRSLERTERMMVRSVLELLGGLGGLNPQVFFQPPHMFQYFYPGGVKPTPSLPRPHQ